MSRTISCLGSLLHIKYQRGSKQIDTLFCGLYHRKNILIIILLLCNDLFYCYQNLVVKWFFWNMHVLKGASFFLSSMHNWWDPSSLDKLLMKENQFYQDHCLNFHFPYYQLLLVSQCSNSTCSVSLGAIS